MSSEQAISLESVYQSVEAWRANKVTSKQATMPDELSEKIIKLADRIGDQKVRTLFGLSSEQLKRKR